MHDSLDVRERPGLKKEKAPRGGEHGDFFFNDRDVSTAAVEVTRCFQLRSIIAQARPPRVYGNGTATTCASRLLGNSGKGVRLMLAEFMITEMTEPLGETAEARLPSRLTIASIRG